MVRVTLACCLCITLFTALDAAADSVADLPDCSASRTNRSCKLVVDRQSPLSPSTLQLYSGQYIVVVVKGALWTERYFLENTAGQAALRPDVTALLAQSLISPLGKLQVVVDKSFDESLRNFNKSISTLNRSLKSLQLQTETLLQKQFKLTPNAINEGSDVEPGSLPEANAPTAPSVRWRACNDVFIAREVSDAVLASIHSCVDAMSRDAAGLYATLEPMSFPDAVTTGPARAVVAPSPAELATLRDELHAFIQDEAAVSAQLSIILRSKEPPLLDVATRFTRLVPFQKLIDAVAADLFAYAQRISDLLLAPNSGLQPCTTIGIAATAGDQCAVLEGRRGPTGSVPEDTTRAVTYSVNILNLVATSRASSADTSKKRALASVPVSFGAKEGHFYDVLDATRWDGSVGLIFSALPNRSFAVQPVFTGEMVTDKRVAQTKTLPTPVPFVALNYRLTNDLPTSTWKSNLYVTGLAGINPNTSTTDFGAGMSLSVRSLMVSVVAHFGHDTELTQGLKVDQNLGAGFRDSLTTRTFWTTTIAVGVSIRVPALTGR